MTNIMSQSRNIRHKHLEWSEQALEFLGFFITLKEHLQ